MEGTHDSRDSIERYLQVLGVPRRPPSPAALCELTAAHLTRIPFENVSKLYYRHVASAGIPGLEAFLDGIERHHFGGTCYSNNYHLHQLLRHLGYDAALCGADMTSANVHVVNVVTVARRRYLVDVGYAAPFLSPLPLDLAEDHEIAWGGGRYVLKPAIEDGRARLERYRDGVPVHGYVVNPAPRRIEDFAGVVAESLSDRAVFMHALLIARFFPQRSVTLRNLSLIEAGPTTAPRVRTLTRAELPEAIEREFGIPGDVSVRALDGVEFTRQA
jgi:N-hydroxyarylamine O-acetyltransferase